MYEVVNNTRYKVFIHRNLHVPFRITNSNILVTKLKSNQFPYLKSLLETEVDRDYKRI